MTILTEGTRKAEFLVSEANAFRSRDTGTVTVPSGGLASGTVLGQITATGKFIRQDTAAVDGSEAHAAVLFEPLTVAGDIVATIIARDAEVNADDLTYEAGATAGEITAANAALAALGIIVR